MSMRESIEAKLTAALRPQRLAVINESHLHAGHHHSGPGHHGTFDGTGETHMRIRIVAAEFAGMSRLARHRRVNALLGDEIAAGLHALAIDAAAPGEPVGW